MPIRTDESPDWTELTVTTDTGLMSFSIDGDSPTLTVTVGERGGKKASVTLSFQDAVTFSTKLGILWQRCVNNARKKDIA